MSMWDDLGLGDKIGRILADAHSHDANHHFGRPFMLPYQIAIEFKRRHPEEFRAIGKPVGGMGTGRQDSLAQYIGQRLSALVKEGREPHIEGRFLSKSDLTALEFDDGGQVVKSSIHPEWDASMFRWRD